MQNLDHLSDQERDGTIRFIPERLNRQPVVIRGMTNDEMFAVSGIGLAVGIIVGIFVMIATGRFAMLVTAALIVAALVFWFGSALLQRVKRGKPETWFYRKLQWQLARLGISFGGSVLQRSGRWAAKHQKRIEALK